MDLLSITEAEDFLFGDEDSGAGGPFLSSLITDVSARFAAFTGRDDWGDNSSRTEYHDGGRAWIVPRYAPIVSVTTIHEDSEHVWHATNDLIAAADYYVDTDGKTGLIWLESGCFIDGPKTIKLVYTGGYASVAAVPVQVKAAAKIQLEEEWRKRKSAGRSFRDDVILGHLLPEVERSLRPYMVRLPFA